MGKVSVFQKMSLNKSIQSGKSHRKPYRGGKAIDKTCRNHGGCHWCLENRTHKNDKRELAAEQELREYVKRSGNNNQSKNEETLGK